ncbi:hypothetical protein PHLGIDRAFT_72642 [Phlebiopsis gigantea 11061_1 CR5-6]|uniref:Uncharacterized protein n=1 Tax=Phlebiopsis gigantea (strain 11061_1 CR5-6) TaxID=745531 RepID=A0A0C3S6Z1_PHLG1|nr:hypothetical protein PHLGIDRAFT_72642 [Phlebiopsis gigantea 11061_1 CR5-6]
MRASPAVGVGGMYATGTHVDDVVRTAAMIPSLFRQQIWKLTPVEEKGTGKYYSISLMDGANHEPWFWSSIGDKPQPESPVILSTDREGKVTWRVTPLDNGVKDAYT